MDLTKQKHGFTESVSFFRLIREAQRPAKRGWGCGGRVPPPPTHRRQGRISGLPKGINPLMRRSVQGNVRSGNDCNEKVTCWIEKSTQW